MLLALVFLTGCVSNSIYSINGVDAPEHLDSAIATVGLTEKNNYKELKAFMGVDPRYIEWCAAYVNAILEMHGYPTTDSYMARSFLKYGEKAIIPEVGDIVVLSRGESWQGHVGFFVEKKIIDGSVYYVLLGGNQSDAITFEAFKASRVLSVRKLRFEFSEPD